MFIRLPFEVFDKSRLPPPLNPFRYLRRITCLILARFPRIPMKLLFLNITVQIIRLVGSVHIPPQTSILVKFMTLCRIASVVAINFNKQNTVTLGICSAVLFWHYFPLKSSDTVAYSIRCYMMQGCWRHKLSLKRNVDELNSAESLIFLFNISLILKDLFNLNFLIIRFYFNYLL